jgi:hypothetical protein
MFIIEHSMSTSELKQSLLTRNDLLKNKKLLGL